MIGLHKKLEEVEQEYLDIQERLEKIRVPDVPGNLEVKQNNHLIYYYQRRLDKKTNKMIRKYIRREEMHIAQQLAQKAYYQKLQRLLEQRLPLIHRLIENFHDDELDRAYEDMHQARKALISPIIPTKRENLARWIQKPYSPNPMPKRSAELVTNQGEVVRSKTEKILADLFYDAKVPYKYECPLWLTPNQSIYPDFTFLDPETGEEVYWEHFGKMDDPAYANRSLEKIKLYEAKGIFLGERLLVTFESSTIYLNIEAVRRTIAERLKWPE